MNIKVSRTGLIAALKKALKTRETAVAQQEKAQEEHQKALKDYEDKVLAYVISGKAANPRVRVHHDGEATVIVSLPAALKKKPQMKDMDRFYPSAEIMEIKSAIALLELSDEDKVSASTYKHVSQYLA